MKGSPELAGMFSVAQAILLGSRKSTCPAAGYASLSVEQGRLQGREVA